MTGDRFRQSARRLSSNPQPRAAALALAQRYSYVLPDARALGLIAALSPLVEIGAGTGYWAHRLRARGADIVAFDQAPPGRREPNRYHPGASTWTTVLGGDLSALAGHPHRTLFVCWPPLYSALGECLQHYTGSTIAYIGDNGHQTASLNNLARNYTRLAVHPVRALDPMPGAAAVLSIWRRRI